MVPAEGRHPMREFLLDLLKWVLIAVVFGLLVWIQRRFISR